MSIGVKIDDKVKVAVVATETVDGRAERTNTDVGKKLTQREL